MALSNPPLMRRDEGQGSNVCTLFKGTQKNNDAMEILDVLGIQAAISFFSSMAGMAVYMYIFCPNRRCCNMSRVRNACEQQQSNYLDDSRNRKTEDFKHG